MISTICKYPLKITYSQNLEIPLNAQVLKIDFQDNIPYVWVSFWVENELKKETRNFITVSTGMHFEYETNMRFIDSYILLENDTYLVFHVFEKH